MRGACRAHWSVVAHTCFIVLSLSYDVVVAVERYVSEIHVHRFCNETVVIKLPLNGWLKPAVAGSLQTITQSKNQVVCGAGRDRPKQVVAKSTLSECHLWWLVELFPTVDSSSGLLWFEPTQNCLIPDGLLSIQEEKLLLFAVNCWFRIFGNFHHH